MNLEAEAANQNFSTKQVNLGTIFENMQYVKQSILTKIVGETPATLLK